jgi:hypothetical protein
MMLHSNVKLSYAVGMSVAKLAAVGSVRSTVADVADVIIPVFRLVGVRVADPSIATCVPWV